MKILYYAAFIILEDDVITEEFETEIEAHTFAAQYPDHKSMVCPVVDLDVEEL